MYPFKIDNDRRAERVKTLILTIESIQHEMKEAVDSLGRQGSEYYQLLDEALRCNGKPSIKEQYEKATGHLINGDCENLRNNIEELAGKNDIEGTKKFHAGLAKLQKILICVEAGVIVCGAYFVSTVAAGTSMAVTMQILKEALITGNPAPEALSSAAQTGNQISEGLESGDLHLAKVKQTERAVALAQINRVTKFIKGATTKVAWISGVLVAVDLALYVYEEIEASEQHVKLKKEIRNLCEIRFAVGIVQEEFMTGKRWIEEQMTDLKLRAQLADMVEQRIITQEQMEKRLDRVPPMPTPHVRPRFIKSGTKQAEADGPRTPGVDK
ncbi:hypothetical protein RSOLAG22IIIB_12365 [Rhizoctonia solani]|uniref:Uncharacterized protein n=1 Tax=Rhizoctonia solani TaxID=456999 RepID=A0A0K6GD71_9AGAM|nr:hypothetical protein RSOLAG22IIIB_12365 [Rhizoctonia solani]